MEEGIRDGDGDEEQEDVEHDKEEEDGTRQDDEVELCCIVDAGNPFDENGEEDCDDDEFHAMRMGRELNRTKKKKTISITLKRTERRRKKK